MLCCASFYSTTYSHLHFPSHLTVTIDWSSVMSCMNLVISNFCVSICCSRYQNLETQQSIDNHAKSVYHLHAPLVFRKTTFALIRPVSLFDMIHDFHDQLFCFICISGRWRLQSWTQKLSLHVAPHSLGSATSSSRESKMLALTPMGVLLSQFHILLVTLTRPP